MGTGARDGRHWSSNGAHFIQTKAISRSLDKSYFVHVIYKLPLRCPQGRNIAAVLNARAFSRTGICSTQARNRSALIGPSRPRVRSDHRGAIRGIDQPGAALRGATERDHRCIRSPACIDCRAVRPRIPLASRDPGHYHINPGSGPRMRLH